MMDNNDEENLSSDGVSDTWMKLSDSDYARVIFYDVCDTYPSGTDVICYYSLTSLITPDGEDYIGLYRIGWKNVADYVISQKVTDAFPNPVDKHQICNIFKADTLPKDGEFYQFCYLTVKGEIRGASTPFRFQDSVKPNDECVALENDGEDFLLVYSQQAVLEKKLLESEQYNQFLQHNNEELEDKIKDIKNIYQLEIQSIKDKYKATLSANDDIKTSLEILQNDCGKHAELLVESKLKIDKLECDLKDQKDINEGLKSLMKSLSLGKEQLAEKLEILIQERNSLQASLSANDDIKTSSEIQQNDCDNHTELLAENNLKISELECNLKAQKDVNEGFKSLMKSLVEGKEQLAEKLEIVIQERNSLQSYVEDLREKLQDSRSRNDVQKLTEDAQSVLVMSLRAKYLELDLQKKKAEYSELENLFKEKEEERSFLQMQLEDTKAMFLAQEDTKSLMLKELAAHKEFRNQITTMLENAKSENFNLKKKLKELKHDKIQTVPLLESAKSDNFNLKKKLKELKRDKILITKELDCVKSENAALKNKMEEIGVEIKIDNNKMEAVSLKRNEKESNISLLEMAETIQTHIKEQKKQEITLSRKMDELELRLLAGAKEFESQYFQIAKLKKHIKKLERYRKKNSSSNDSSMKESSPGYSCTENISADENHQGKGLQNKNLFHIIRIKGTTKCNDSDTGECLFHSVSNAPSPGPLTVNQIMELKSNEVGQLSMKKSCANPQQNEIHLEQLEHLMNKNAASICQSESSKSGVKISNERGCTSSQTTVKDTNLCDSFKSHSSTKNIQEPFIPAPNVICNNKISVKSNDLLSHSDSVEGVLPPPLTPAVAYWSDSCIANDIRAQNNAERGHFQHFVAPYQSFNEALELPHTVKMFSMEEYAANIFEVPCPICETKFPVVADDNTFLLAHLKELHGQEPCPMCGQLFDMSLPQEYFHFHVENHFHGEDISSNQREATQNVKLHSRSTVGF